MNIQKIIAVVFCTAALCACATGSYIVTGQKRPAIDVTEVSISFELPPEYEMIGIVEASSEVGFSSQSAQDRAVNELKKQAAKIGANQVILLNSYTESGRGGTPGIIGVGAGVSSGTAFSSGAGGVNAGIGFNSNGGGNDTKKLQGQAIYVSPEIHQAEKEDEVVQEE